MIEEQVNLIESLEWRYATKKFNNEKQIPENEMGLLLKSLQLSPSSMGLQPYHFFQVKDPERRKALREVSFNQKQITDASELIVFAAKTKLAHNDIERFVRLNAEIRQKDEESRKRNFSRLSQYIAKFDDDALFNWTSRQAYIAMGLILSSAAQLKIDACPMEGIQGEEYDRILDLEPLNLRTISVVTLGYRSDEDKYQWEPKVRKPLDDLITTI